MNSVLWGKNHLLLWESFGPWKTLTDQIRADFMVLPICLLSAAQLECYTPIHLGLPTDYLILQHQKSAGHCPSIMRC